MVTEINIVDYEKPNSIVVPINVIQDFEGKKVVFIAVKQGNNYVAKKVVVQVGRLHETSAEIIEGLAEGDQLITTGYQELTDGQIIKL